jgi:DGQHR domain-containing protein
VDSGLRQGLKYFPPFDAISVKQGRSQFYIFSMNSRDLLEIAYTNPRTQDRKVGVQRGLDKKRLKEIGTYYKGELRPGILPNSIIVSLSKDAYFKAGKLFIPMRTSAEPKEAFVLDGQHRLWAFSPEYADKISMNLVVSAFIDIPDDMKAYIFQTINMTQRKINPSLVYDLIPMLRKEWVKFEDARARAILERLNGDSDSPWYDGVEMLGGRQRPITQASFITRLKTLFKKGNVFENTPDNEFYEEAIQIELLVEYFAAIREVFSEAWNKRTHILCKNTGFATMLNLLKYILEDLRKKRKLTDSKGLVVARKDFKRYFNRIADFSFRGEEYGTAYLGEAGIRELTEELRVKMLGR